MLKKARGKAAGLALILALAGCSSDGDSGDTGGGAGGASGGASGASAAAAPLNPSQLAQAIPGKLAAPEGWKGREPRVLNGGEAQKHCQLAARFSCAGLTGMANTQISASYDTDVKFELLAYDSVENAKAGMKTLVADTREGAKADTLKPLTIDVGADETDAYAKENRTNAALRVGTVVAFVIGSSLPKDHDLHSFASMQVQRITTAAAGKNPDA
ncbi:hypothetical protein ACFVGY_18855 [Streptomyces sp. NPDC127106]|uniref:hypothetical protein n=1 Tax=Streptomyces sp. NPDC127106 TaxID=3345360 RepID=UPI00363C03DC